MSEGPEIEQKRKDLRVEMEKFDGAMAIIVNLESREREQAAAASSQYTNGFDPSQAEDMVMLDATQHPNGVPVDQRTVYSATQVGDA